MSTAGADKRGLLVDSGGVLTTNVWECFDEFCQVEGLERGAVREMFKREPEAVADLRLLETGEIDEEEFARRLGPRLGIERTDGLVGRMFAALRPEPRMIDAVRAARRGGVSTGLISNSWGLEMYDRGLLGDLFDAVVISGEVGLHKPQPEIFLLAAERLGVTPAQCVFVDDLRENVAGAEAVGMTAVLHRDPEATAARLEELLGVPIG
jgi:putative hydrolase of the HAD superfamily